MESDGGNVLGERLATFALHMVTDREHMEAVHFANR